MPFAVSSAITLAAFASQALALVDPLSLGLPAAPDAGPAEDVEYLKDAQLPAANDPLSRWVKIPCSDCPFYENGQWIEKMPNDVYIQSRIDQKEHKYFVGKAQHYPRPDMSAEQLMAPINAFQIKQGETLEGVKAADPERKSLAVTGYRLAYAPIETVDATGLESILSNFTILELNRKSVPPQTEITTLHKAAADATLTIKDIQVVPSPQFAMSVDGNLDPNSEFCQTHAVLCWLHMFRSRLQSMPKRIGKKLKHCGMRMMKHGKHHKLMDHPSKTDAFNPTATFEAPSPIQSSTAPSATPSSHAEVAEAAEAPASVYRHFRQADAAAHRRTHRIARIISHVITTIFVPIIVGVVAGSVTYLLGWAIGAVVAFFYGWATGRRGGQGSGGKYNRIALDDENSCSSYDEFAVGESPYADDVESAGMIRGEKDALDNQERPAEMNHSADSPPVYVAVQENKQGAVN